MLFRSCALPIYPFSAAANAISDASQNILQSDINQTAGLLPHNVDEVASGAENASALYKSMAELVSSLAAFKDIVDVIAEVSGPPRAKLLAHHTQVHPFLRLAWGVASAVFKVCWVDHALTFDSPDRTAIAD